MTKPNIDVAHNGDCGFESIAASLIDLHRAGELEDAHEQKKLYQLLEVYLSYFPMRPKLPTSKAIFDDLIETVPPRQLVQNLAFAIRQHAVNVMVADPGRYPGAFTDKTEGTSPATMRKPGTWIDGGALAAFCNSTQIPVNVQFGSRSIPLYDGPKVCKKPIEMTLSGGHYQPTVKDPTYFNRDRAIPKSPPAVIAYDDPSSEKIHERIRQMIMQDEKRDKEITEKLSTLSVEKLIECYQKQMYRSDYLINKIVMVTAEQGGDLFFENAIKHNTISEDPKLKAALVQALGKEIYRTHYDKNIINDMFASEQKSEFKPPRSKL